MVLGILVDKWVGFGVGKPGYSSVQEEVQVEAEWDQGSTAADIGRAECCHTGLSLEAPTKAAPSLLRCYCCCSGLYDCNETYGPPGAGPHWSKDDHQNLFLDF